MRLKTRVRELSTLNRSASMFSTRSRPSILSDLTHVARRFGDRGRLGMTAFAGLLALVLSAPALAIEVGAVAPPLDLSGTTGHVNLEQYRGKTVWLDFWASWCGPCKQSFPWMNALQERYASQGLQVVAVNVDTRSSDAMRFLADHAVRFAVAFDPTGSTPRSYQIKGMPTSVLIGPDGRVLMVHSGFRDTDQTELDLKIRRALGVQK